jgi:hypothetical protein
MQGLQHTANPYGGNRRGVPRFLRRNVFMVRHLTRLFH